MQKFSVDCLSFCLFYCFLNDVIANQLKLYFRKMKNKQTELYISEPIDSDSEGNALTIEDIISSNINVEQIAELKIDSERLCFFY